MHVLLIDDSESKINQLKRFLIDQGIDENDLLIAEDAVDASKKLLNSLYTTKIDNSLK